MLKIAIRADGGPSIGMGHIMRCLNLAIELRLLGCEIFFISKIKEGILKIINSGFTAIPLEYNDNIKNIKGFEYGDKAELKTECNNIINIINEYSLDAIIVDSYNVDDNYLLTIKKHVKKLCYIDDVNEFVYPVDVLINGNVTGKLYRYHKFYDNEIMFLGTEYNLTRQEFRDIPQKKINKNIKEIMITVGGADPQNATIKLLDIINQHKVLADKKINVIVGPAFTNIDVIKNYSLHFSNLNVMENVHTMSKIMMSSDIAISAGGSTLYELCACGVPTIALIFAENQKGIVEYLEKANLIFSAGWFNELRPEKFQLILNNLICDNSIRENMSKSMQNLIDGYGAKRLADQLIKCLSY